MFAKPLMIAASALMLWCAGSPALAAMGQLGPKLVGSGAIAPTYQGGSVALSADGYTMIVGGSADNGDTGAAWVFTRSGATWTQQGPKMIGTGAAGKAYQGAGVALSADGNTAIVGGIYDNVDQGAAWVYVRNAGTWNQQGPKLVGTGSVGNVNQGYAVALSADGNTAIVGGFSDNQGRGAAWIYTRNGAGVWSQQGAKLVGSGALNISSEGFSVALSADGNTVIVGGPADNFDLGAAWVFTRSAGVWSQQGAKLVGTGSVGNVNQGWAVALSADGNTAMVGGKTDNSNTGATWVFTRSAGVWSQQGTKLVATGTVGPASQGSDVALSFDGNTAIIGGEYDDAGIGTAWMFRRKAGVWSQRGAKLMGTGAVGTTALGHAVALSGDGLMALVGGLHDNTSVGAVWVYVEGPAITMARDIPNDQGGKLSVRWTASLLDIAPLNPIDAYWIWRRVPSATALQALGHGATLIGERTDPAFKSGRVFRTTQEAATVYWEFLGSQVAHGFPAYSYTASTVSDSVPGSNPYTMFMVEAEKLSTGEYWSSDPDSGYSVDNLPPGPPAPHAALYAGGVTHLYWEPNGDADFAQYRLYRGVTASFIPGPATLLASQAGTAYDDPGTASHYYKLSAVDAHGNESGFALISPTGTVGVDVEPALAFALEGVRPNPTRGDRLSVSFALPSNAPARLELLDMSGRRMLTREVGSLGAGRHSVKFSEGRRLAPGLYWVRLTQAAMSRTARVVVIE